MPFVLFGLFFLPSTLTNLLFSPQLAVQFMLLKLLPSDYGADPKFVVTTILILFRSRHHPGFTTLLIDLNYILFPPGMFFQMK